MLTAKEVAYEVTKALDSKKGMDIKLLRIDEVSSLADYFLSFIGFIIIFYISLTSSLYSS